MLMQKRLLNTPLESRPDTFIFINGKKVPAVAGEPLIEAVNRAFPARGLPQVCYHPQLGPIETCDCCMVEINGQLARACGTAVRADMKLLTESARADAAQREAFDRILQNHDLYCTVCDNNNGNCTIHNTTANLHVEHQSRPYQSKPYEQDCSSWLYRSRGSSISR